MRGFALSESLMALSIVSLLFVVMLSRGPDLEAREAERRAEAFMYDAAGDLNLEISDDVVCLGLTNPQWIFCHNRLPGQTHEY